MREIKYQAWYNGKMYVVNMIIWYSKTNIVYGLTDPKLPGSQIHVGINEAQRREYTGLHDRNGKAIYEGDILTVDWKDSRYPTHTIGPVTWDRENACWSLGEGGSPKHDAENYMEVIGNMYENND